MSWAGNYSTDVLHHKALGLIDEALELDNPFFLTIATNAPHSNVGSFQVSVIDPDDIGSLMTAPIPAERHKDLFKNVVVPRTKNFNPDTVCSYYAPHILTTLDIIDFGSPMTADPGLRHSHS